MTESRWTEIGRRLHIRDAEQFARSDIIPHLAGAPVEGVKKNGERENRLELPMSLGFFAFVAIFIALNVILPDTFVAAAAKFVLFPILFLGAIFLSFYLFRDRLVEALTKGQARFLARSKALSTLADQIGLAYVPAPGGAPAALQWVAKQQWAPTALRAVTELLDDHGGMDDALQAARLSGVMMGNAQVIGGDDARRDYLQSKAQTAHVEDGFRGERGGVPFSAFEWVESDGDSGAVHHLVMVFTAPRRLFGVTQLRSRHITWPGNTGDAALKPVGVVAPAFEDRFRMRSSDQVEARAIFDPAVLERVADLAHGEKVRAVAFQDHLVIDVEGEDRFAMIDLVTGEWSEETVAASLHNVADMLDLADAVARAFNLRAAA